MRSQQPNSKVVGASSTLYADMQWLNGTKGK